MNVASKSVGAGASSPATTPEPASAANDCQAVVKRLYPSLSEGERSLAVANLLRYFEVACEIGNEELSSEQGLTPPAPLPTIKERSNGNLKP